jgi:hypothetical protein
MRYIPEFATVAAACVAIVTAALGTPVQWWELICVSFGAGTWALLSAYYRKTARR